MQTRYKIAFWTIGLVFLLLFLFAVRGILLPFVVGMLLAYFLDPAADRLEKWGCSRSTATAIITGGFFLLMILLAMWLLPIISHQLGGLIDSIPGNIAVLQEHYQSWMARFLNGIDPGQIESAKTAVGNLSGDVIGFIGGFLKGLLSSGAAIVNMLSLIFITPVVVFYMLRDWDRMVAKIDALLPRQYAATIREQAKEIDHTLSGFIRGQMNVCLLLGTFYAIGLTLVGLNFGLLIGLVTGMLVIIPYVGLFMGMAVGLSVAFFQFGDMVSVGKVLAVFVVGQVIEGNFIVPKLVGDRIGLGPVWIIFGLLAGGALFGFVGVLLALPVTAVIGVLVKFAVNNYLHSPLYKTGQSITEIKTP